MSGSIITAKVTGVDKYRLAFGSGIAKAVRADLRRTIDRLAVELQTEVKQNWLTGPRPQRLGVVTGTGRRSINIERIDTPDKVVAKVGTNLFYMVAWELGHVRTFTGRVQAARPFLEPAYMKLRAHIESEIRASVLRAVRKGGVLGV